MSAFSSLAVSSFASASAGTSAGAASASAEPVSSLSAFFEEVFLLFLAGAGCYFFLKKVAFRKAGFYSAFVMVCLSAISMYYASQQSYIKTAHEHAIVMTPTVTLRSTPAESGTQLLIIHEGLKVKVRQKLSGWSEVELSDGNVGWMPSEQLEVI